MKPISARKLVQSALAPLLGTAVLALAGLVWSNSANAIGSPNTAAPACPKGWYYSERCGHCAHRCRSGKAWSCSARKCVTKSSLNLSDDELYLEAVSLIEAGRYDEALAALLAITRRDDPKVLNYIGYSTRKLGDVDEGIAYYRKALALDPDYVRAREYLGEGYLQKGDLESAKRELREIYDRCGTDCREYRMLSEAIVHHLTGEKPASDW